MSYRDADGINGLLVYVLTPAQWATHPTNIQAAGPPMIIRPAPTWPEPVAPVGAAANALVSAYERQLKDLTHIKSLWRNSPPSSSSPSGQQTVPSSPTLYLG
jgi:hypothetical protein